MKKTILIIAFLLTAAIIYGQCNYTLELNDSYGDGWNGNTIDVIVNSDTTNYTLASGSQITYPIAVNDGDSIVLDYLGGGSYNSEVSFRLLDSGGAEVYSSGLDPAVGVHYTGTATCPSCMAPSNIIETNITTTSVDLGWTENGTATLWNIEWGLATFVQGTGTMISGVTTNPYALSGLTQNTAYDWYIQADCVTDSSTWTGPSRFTTLCDAITTFPWSENFDAAPTTPDCWTNDSTEEWEFSTSASYGASSDHTSGSGNLAWLDDSTPYDNPSNLDTPNLDVTGLTTPQLKFYYWIGEATTGSYLCVDIFNGTAWTDSVGYYTPNNQWDEATIDLSSYSSTTTKIRFRAMESLTTYNCDICIDDVTVRETPSCVEPTGQVATNVTTSSADLAWIENNTPPATLWDIEWGLSGFTQGTGTTVTGITDTTYALTGLSGGTGYGWYVRADCGTRETSPWTGPSSFATLVTNDSCSVAIAIGEVTDQPFDTSTATTSGFDTNNINQDIWYVYTASANGLLDVDLCGSSFDTKLAVYEECDVLTELAYNDDSSYCGDATSSVHDIPVVNGEDYMIQVGGYGSYSGPGDITIILDDCPAPDSCATTNIWQTTADLGWYEYGSTTTWNIEIDTTGFTPTGIPTHSAGTNPYTVINLLAETDYDWYVQSDCGADSSAWVGPNSFTTLAACPFPTALTETNIGPDQADLGWTQTGGVTTWEIEIDTTGFTPTGIATYTNVILNPFTVTGLLNETSYEWYVRADCGGGTYSTWVGPGSFTTLVGCPAPTSPITTNIAQTTADLDWTDGWAETYWHVEWDTTGFVLGTGNYYSVNSHPYGITTLTQNTSYDWYVRADCDGPFIPGDESVWIGPITFTTLCDPITTYPYTENFDALSTVPDCWVVDPVVSGDSWEVFSSNPGHGAPSDHTTGTGNFMGVDDSSPETVPAHLYSIQFDLTSLTVPLLEFYYWIGDATTTSELRIDIDDGTTVTTDVAVFGETIDHWALAQVNLGAFAGLSIIIDFRAMESSSFYGDICLDDVTVKETPLCPAPTALYTDTITDSTANLNWTANGTETYWNVEYDTTGFVQGTGTLISTNTNPHILTGLSAVTTYDWYVQADCSTTRDSSAWVGPSTFATTGSYPLPYSQDFATWLPAGWTTTGGTNWQQGLGNSAGGTAPEARFYWSPGTVATQRLISPTIDTQGETSINVEFRHYLDNYGGDLTIMLQTTSDGTTWNTTSFNLVNPVGNVGPEFQSIIVNNADVGSENFQCAFVFDGNSFNLDNWYVDDVEVIVSPPATLAITPSPFDFGDVPYNKIPTQVFTMSNTGVGTVTVNSASDITLSGDAEFTIVSTYFSNTPGVIPPDTVTVEVQFAPGAAISYSTVLSVVWTGAMDDRSVTNATISGTGCTPVANDDCVNATAVSGPYPVAGSGSNECAWIDCPGLLDWYTVWYEIDLPYECQDVEITICAADTNTVLASVGIILMDDCACDDYIVRQDGLGAGWITCASGAQGYNMIFPSISGYPIMLWPSYLIDANGGVAFTYEIDVTPCETPNAPQDVSVAVAGSIVTVSWTYHSELTYTVYSDIDPYGTFTYVEGTGIAANHLDITPIPGVPTFYRVTCDNPPVRTRTYSDGINIIERAPKVIAPNRKRQ